MISIMHEDFRENITWDCFCFSWIQKYMLMGYIYCHSESMFVALNIVVKEKKKKTTMSWEYQSKRTFLFYINFTQNVLPLGCIVKSIPLFTSIDLRAST